MVLPASKAYPGKVFFFTADPDALIEAGYDSLRVEKRTTRLTAWEVVTNNDASLLLESGRFNYHYVDTSALVGNEFRAVLQNSADPGNPADVNQPAQKAVDTSYEQIMTIRELVEQYLWGQDPAFVADDGSSQPLYTYAHNIRYGISVVEQKLGIKLLPTHIVEKHDYMRENGMARGMWPSFHLDQFPVIGTPTITLNVPGATAEAYPEEWVRVHEETGDLMLVPDGVVSGPGFPGALLSRHQFIPDAFEIEYFAGFEPGSLPAALKEIVGLEAALGPLNVGGDLVGGAGLAGTSISLDGLSQSITTTNSSTNAGFGARILTYGKQTKDFYKSAIPFYRGLRMRVA